MPVTFGVLTTVVAFLPLLNFPGHWGSYAKQIPYVVIPVLMHSFVMLQRNLIYTALTRGRKLVVLLGQEKALSLAVRGRPLERRTSRVRELLQGAES